MIHTLNSYSNILRIYVILVKYQVLRIFLVIAISAITLKWLLLLNTAREDWKEHYSIIAAIDSNSIYKKVDSHNFPIKASPCDKMYLARLRLLFIGLSSEIINIDRRQTIRETWGKVANTESEVFNYKVKIVFFVGKSHDAIETKNLIAEAKTYGDIVQADFFDSYRNMTLKTMSIFEFASEYCPQASFYMKSDDDCWINIPLLIGKYAGNESKMIFSGELRSGSGPVRDPKHRWYISLEEWAHNFFPDYVSGGGYLLSKPALKEVYGFCKFFRVVSMEDIRMSICAQLVQVNRTNDNLINTVAKNVTSCYMHKMMVVHPVSSKLLRSSWPEIQELRRNKTNCH